MDESWVGLVEKKALIIHEQLASARALALRNDISTGELDRPYFDLLSQLYREEFPLAQLIDSSDLVARFEGGSISRGSTPAKIVAAVVKALQDQIRIVAEAIAGLNSDVPWPNRLDPLVTGLTKGSLVIGISIPSSSDGGLDTDGQSEFPALPDPVLDSVRDAVRGVAVVPQYVCSDHIDQSIEEVIPDPAVRDTVLVAASKLAPTSRRGFDELILFGPNISNKDVTPLTVESRKVLQRAVAQPANMKRSATFTGTVRAIDLDAKRFEIRHVEEVNDGSIRCKYTNIEIENEKDILDRVVRVRGRYAQHIDGTPRLMDVISIDVGTQHGMMF